jgi:hypothetical protein
MMERTQISLPAEDLSRARARASALGISLAEYIRRLLARDLDRPTATADISSIFGLFDSGGSDVSRFKDQYIAEALEAEYRRESGR